MLKIIKAGFQTTLQAGPRSRYRHMGVPWAGAADGWSMALANRLVGNAPDTPALEITLGNFSARFSHDTWFALSGAGADVTLSGETATFHDTLFAPAGAEIGIGGVPAGMRMYLSVAGGFEASEFLGSSSTYLPAQFGGYEGRALATGDEIKHAAQPANLPILKTPENLRPTISTSYALRACVSAETGLLTEQSLEDLFGRDFTIGRQATRMGVSLEGIPLRMSSDGKMKSAAVFPGIIQCPESGTPIILLADAQTTGGYPRVAVIAGCDRHMLGQLRPGDKVRLLRRAYDQALEDALAKQELLQSWVPEFSF